MRSEYEPLISADGENWTMLPPFNVVFKPSSDKATEVWLETRMYHFSMGSIGKILRKIPAEIEFYESKMPWHMLFGHREHVVFGNATEVSFCKHPRVTDRMLKLIA